MKREITRSRMADGGEVDEVLGGRYERRKPRYSGNSASGCTPRELQMATEKTIAIRLANDGGLNRSTPSPCARYRSSADSRRLLL